jgi:hypothetical protein
MLLHGLFERATSVWRAARGLVAFPPWRADKPFIIIYLASNRSVPVQVHSLHTSTTHTPQATARENQIHRHKIVFFSLLVTSQLFSLVPRWFLPTAVLVATGALA